LIVLLSRVARAAKALGPSATLADLIDRHRALESMLIDLAAGIDAIAKAPALGRRIEGQLRRAEARTGASLAEIEERVVRAHARSLDTALRKLRFYGDLQGYDLAWGAHSPGPRSLEERLFRSTVDDLEYLTEQSSDRRRAMKARK
jgi:hypothetical protein